MVIVFSVNDVFLLNIELVLFFLVVVLLLMLIIEDLGVRYYLEGCRDGFVEKVAFAEFEDGVIEFVVSLLEDKGTEHDVLAAENLAAKL